MQPMVSVSVGGIRPSLTMAWKHNRMPPFCKMATRTFKISETYSAATRLRRLFYDMPITLRCANMLAPGTPTRCLSDGCCFRCAQFCIPGIAGHCCFTGIENVREKAFLCTKYTVTHLWYRKRTSGVPNEPRGSGNIQDWHRVRKSAFPPEA